MAVNYDAIREENQRRYGTDIGRIGRMLLADRYDVRTHFIYELLQNAEDALARRADSDGPRSVCFHLSHDKLTVTHFGKPFDDADVRGICGIAQSTKDLTAIGRFGIGFKSVCAFTDRPEIHSGSESFAIESYVWPISATPVSRHANATIIAIPLRDRSAADRDEIIAGLQDRLDARALLFLRQIEEIEWRVDGGPSGHYKRSKPEVLGDSVQRITVFGQRANAARVGETWLLFSKAAFTPEGERAGHVEIAFLLKQEDGAARAQVRPIARSQLVVFFPTALETHLGFLVQGPYRTTPSRDNVPLHDPWNEHCVQETAGLLVEALSWLRDHDLLDTAALRSLPLAADKFGDGAMFAPLFVATKLALATKPLLPRHGGGFVTAGGCKLARTQDLRQLFVPSQLASLFDDDEEELAWVSGDISADRTPDLRLYLMRELDVEEVTPELILSKLDAGFLEAQKDVWILKLYEFLNGQAALRPRAGVLPLIRLVSGKHVKPRDNGKILVFLPGPIETAFPAVRSAVCKTDAAVEFLRSLGLQKPDAVDDVIQNILPKYAPDELGIDADTYSGDIKRIVGAFATDSQEQRGKLLAALRAASFVMAVDGLGKKWRATPGEVLLPTDRLKSLFAGIAEAMFVDEDYGSLHGEKVRDLLEACGSVRFARLVPDDSLTREDRRQLRVRAGHPDTSGRSDVLRDLVIVGLPSLLASLPSEDADGRLTKARLLWDELAHIEERRGKAVFTAEYSWTHYGSHRAEFDAAFVRLLNATAWVPDQGGDLQSPGQVRFDSLGWRENPFLLSKIRFRPPVIDELAREAGIEPGVLDLLRKHGVTSVAELVARLGLTKETEERPEEGDAEEGDGPPVVGRQQPAGSPPAPRGDHGGGDGSGAVGIGTQGGGHGGGQGKESTQGGGKRTPGSQGGRPFVSYVGTHPDEEDPDPDGLDQTARMAIEEQAISLIIAREGDWHRTPAFNPGFDLFQDSPDGKTNRWCEVKAMTGSLENRSVGMSRAQFECARSHGGDYWLYIVEHAGDEGSRIVRIQDPAGRARTFTFDRGWIEVAELDGESG